MPEGERRAAAWLLGLGAAGVLVTCVGYVLADGPAALPGGAPDFEAGRAATAAAAGWMRMAGSFGMPGDVLLVAGALRVSGARRRAGSATGAVGWGLLALSCLLFILVDALVGFALPATAASGGAAAYVLARSTFDALFNIGGWTLGLGALLAALGTPGRELAWRPLRALMGAAGVLGLLVNTSFLLGGPGAQAIGPAVVLSALALLGAGLALGRG